MPPIIGGKAIFCIGVGTILFGIAKVIEHEINYRNETDKTINELKQECRDLKAELKLAKMIENDK